MHTRPSPFKRTARKYLLDTRWISGAFLVLLLMGSITHSTKARTAVFTSIESSVLRPLADDPPCIDVSIGSSSAMNAASVSVPVNVTQMTGLGVRSADFTVTYDKDVLQFTDVTFGAVGSSNGGGRGLTVNSTTPGTLVISVFGSAEFQGAGTLVNLNFSVTGSPAASTSVSLGAFVFNEFTFCGTKTNGTVSVQSGVISGKVVYGNAAGAPLDRRVPGVALSASGSIGRSANTSNTGGYSINGMGAGPYTVTPSKTGDVQGAITGFDASDVAVHVVGNSPQLTGNRAIVADVSGNGTITSFDAAMIATFAVGLTEGIGTAGTWRFLPQSKPYADVNGDHLNQDYEALLMGDVSGSWDHPLGDPNVALEAKEEQVTISAGNVETTLGSLLTVPVTIGETTGLGIRAYEFDLRYDPDVVAPAPTAASLAGTLSSGFVLSVNSTQKGILRIVVFGAYSLDGAGDLIKLHFNVIGSPNTSTELRWENFRLNEGGINFMAQNGAVNVAATSASGSISGRLIDPRGFGVGRTRVTIIDAQGNLSSVTTSSLGYFEVTELQIGGTYTVRPESRRYRFNSQDVNITGSNAVQLTITGLE